VPRETLAGFGVALYRLRAARRWPLRRAADAAGVSVTTVMRAEQGRSVGLAQAIGLAGAYGTTAGALLDGEHGSEGVSHAMEMDTWRKVPKLPETVAAPQISPLARNVVKDQKAGP
jgi:transcriptional regulator with XRE-family HTH domain